MSLNLNQTVPIQICPLCQATYDDTSLEFCSTDGARLQPTSMLGAQWCGRLLGERYEVLSFLGAGGMAEVYEARRLEDQAHVALKLMRPQITDNVPLVERFRLEAQLISLIDHPNVIEVYDWGTFDDGTLYMAMELLRGESLEELLDQGPLAPMIGLEVACQTCRGLQAAHDKGIVHRDVKPANIYLQQAAPGSDEIRVKVLDLGIAKLQGERASNLTATGMVFGSPAYMSPEQALGKSVDARADVYSLGVVLYHLFTGGVPFFADSYVGVLTKHVTSAPTWPEQTADERDFPRAVGEVIIRALEKNPTHRQQTMTDLCEALTQAMLGDAAAAPRERAVLPGQLTSDRTTTASLMPSRATKRLVSLKDASADAENEVVKIADDSYWVGRREGVLLERNVYLRVYRGNGKQLNVIIDPGPTKDVNTVSAKVKKVIGPLENVDVIFLNHQDPDVAGNAPIIQQLNPRAHVLCSEDTWRLASFYGLRPGGYSAVEHFTDLSTKLVTNHRVTFVPTPYCHFRGAVMYYDQATRVLFSGDLFGGLSRTLDLVSTKDAWDGIEIFHQLYMPSSKALRHAVAQVRQLDPAPLLIAPQHGGLLQGDLIEDVLARMQHLEVGVDLLAGGVACERYVKALNNIVDDLIEIAGEKAVTKELKRYSADGSFPNLFVFAGGLVREIKIEPRAALRAFFEHARALVPDGSFDELANRRLEQHALQLPTTLPEPYEEYTVE